MNKTFHCHKISEGQAKGEVLISADDFCFYLVHPQTGVVIEKNHSLYGQSISGKILLFPNGKGSSVVQTDGMFQLKMKGTEPKALVIQNPDTTLVASAILMEMPMVDRLGPGVYQTVQNGDLAELDATNGVLTLHAREENQ